LKGLPQGRTKTAMVKAKLAKSKEHQSGVPSLFECVKKIATQVISHSGGDSKVNEYLA
jgi:hypothetical protein